MSSWYTKQMNRLLEKLDNDEKKGRIEMEKPTMKRHVGITNEFESQGVIYFYANETIAGWVSDFGDVVYAGKPDYYQLYVDARYDFADVVAWLKSLA